MADMAWTTPRTWVAGETVTAAIMNTHVRDDLTFLANPPLFVGHCAATQSIPNNAWTAIVLDTNDVDTYSGHSTSTNNTRYTGQVAGWYMCTARVSHGGNAAGRRGAGFQLNGGGVIAASEALHAAVNVATVQSVYFVQLNGTTDYVEAMGFQDSGGALSTNAGATQVQIVWIHA